MSRLLLSRCPLCRGAVAVRWSQVCVWRCRDCGLMFRNPLPGGGTLERLYTASWSAPVAARFETGGTTDRLARLYAARLAHALGAKRLDGLRILEFGAGRGEFLAALHANGADVCAIEPYGCDLLLRRGFEAYRSLGDLPGGQPFDGVITVDVVEHLARPWEDLAALRGLLKPEGFLYVSTLNAGGLNALLSRSRWREIRKEGHLLFFTVETLQRVLVSAGFDVPQRLRWRIPYHSSVLRRILDFALQALSLDGELRLLARAPRTGAMVRSRRSTMQADSRA